MKADKERIKFLLYEVKENTLDLEKILKDYADAEIVSDKTTIKVIKYTLIELSEGISLVLQHILSKEYGQPVKGYIDTIKKAADLNIITNNLSQRLKPFFDFRNSLIHRYWIVENEKLIQNCREGYQDFYRFIEEIEGFMEKVLDKK